VKSFKNIIVIGASAGGFKAVTQLVSGFKTDLDAAVFIVLHMAKHSMPQVLVRQLERHTDLLCLIPDDNDPIRRGHIYISPADRHMLISDGIIRITKGPYENRYRPSIDVLFRSAAAEHNSKVIGIVLTGMLDDGTSGMLAIKRSGGVCIVQEPAEAEYPDMPRNVLNNVDVDYRVPVGDIGYILDDLLSKPAGEPAEVPEDVRIEAKISERMTTNIDDLKLIADHSDFTCPDCGGGLWAIKNDPNHRYRCHTGHVYTERALGEVQSEALEESIWVCIRMLEERKNLFKTMAAHESETEDFEDAEKFKLRADEIQLHIERLKSVLITLSNTGLMS
jgi:two-component system, chemotaxis family, protein-glutamate methylesterase/glutaminase